MDRKSQASLFILIGIVVIIVIGIFLYQRGSQIKIPEPAKIEEVAAIQNFVQLCLENTAKDSIPYVLEEGGYYDDFSKSIDEAPIRPMVAVYLRNQTKDMPNISTFENSLASYVNENILSCTESFKKFEGVQVEESEPKTNVTISGKNAFFSLDYKIKITKQGQTAELRKFNSMQEAEISSLLKVAEAFVDVQKENQPYFQISTLVNLSSNNNLTFIWEHLQDGEKMTISKTNSTGLTFAVRYNES